MNRRRRTKMRNFRFFLDTLRRLREEMPKPPGLAEAITNARVNGGDYRGDELKPAPWEFSSDTWLQRRKEELKRRPADD
jgi:hypothetical protein